MSRTKWLALGIKLLLTAGLFWLILRGCDWSAIRQRLGALSAVALAGMFLLISVQTVVLALRWRWITESMGYPLPLRDGLMGQLISQFFNQGLPSSIGGDGVRVWWLKRRGVPLRPALENVLFDRLAGLVTLLLLVPVSLALLAAMTDERAPLWGLALVVVGGVVGVILVVLTRRLGLGNSLQASRRLPARVLAKGLRWLDDFGRLMWLACRTPANLTRVGGSGTGVHLLSVLLGYFIAWELGVPVSFAQCLAAIPPALLVAYMPVSIAGWGVREGAVVVAFGLIGIPAADAVVVSVTLGLGYLFVALCGGLVWVAGGFRRLIINPT
jgi:glycosyltransferase 2 family protein